MIASSASRHTQLKMVSTGLGIRDLAVIGDQRTAAVLTSEGAILCYCPGRFDHPSLLAGLLDPNGGAWLIDLPGSSPAGRKYVDESAVLKTRLAVGTDECTVTDWMPAGPKAPSGLICRIFSEMPRAANITLRQRPDYGRTSADIVSIGNSVCINGSAHYLYASHPMVVEDDTVGFTLAEGEIGWAVLPTRHWIRHRRAATSIDG